MCTCGGCALSTMRPAPLRQVMPCSSSLSCRRRAMLCGVDGRPRPFAPTRDSTHEWWEPSAVSRKVVAHKVLSVCSFSAHAAAADLPTHAAHMIVQEINTGSDSRTKTIWQRSTLSCVSIHSTSLVGRFVRRLMAPGCSNRVTAWTRHCWRQARTESSRPCVAGCAPVLHWAYFMLAMVACVKCLRQGQSGVVQRLASFVRKLGAVSAWG